MLSRPITGRYDSGMRNRRNARSRWLPTLCLALATPLASGSWMLHGVADRGIAAVGSGVVEAAHGVASEGVVAPEHGAPSDVANAHHAGGQDHGSRAGHNGEHRRGDDECPCCECLTACCTAVVPVLASRLAPAVTTVEVDRLGWTAAPRLVAVRASFDLTHPTRAPPLL